MEFSIPIFLAYSKSFCKRGDSTQSNPNRKLTFIFQILDEDQL